MTFSTKERDPLVGMGPWVLETTTIRSRRLSTPTLGPPTPAHLIGFISAICIT